MARVLFITQKVDKNDDLLGVYHKWIEKLAEKVGGISVICLQKGNFDLPDNVKVFSLGKEQYLVYPHLIQRLTALLRFYKYIWQLRERYDVVFVHMNSEYVVLAGWLWKLLGKRIIFWRNHPMGDIRARVAAALSNIILYTSPSSFTARYKKARQMPVGVDVNMFRRMPEIQKKKNSILYLGRISPIKNLDVLIKAASRLDEKGVDFSLTIAGAPSKDSEYGYQEEIKRQAEALVKKGKIKFIGSVPNHKTPELYNSHEIFVNLTPSGSFDKTIIEAMACESLMITSNNAVREVLPQFFCFYEKDVSDLSRALADAFQLSDVEKANYGVQFRRYVIGKHDLEIFADQLTKILERYD